MHRRSQLLASRLEAGATLLADLVRNLTDAEWNTRVRDGRKIGVIVHHVATMYPIEIDVANLVASGKPVVGLSWQDVAEINAKHAIEFGDVTRAEALALLKKNSQAAAEAIRGFTDDQLDTAAAFSLSYDAPMTAQFVLEDHAMRHSFHHLAGIRAALGRREAATMAGAVTA